MRKQRHLDVSWYLPKRKRPFAYSTKAISDLIVLLAQEYTTIQDVYDHYNMLDEGKEILKTYIDKGYGDVVAASWFK